MPPYLVSPRSSVFRRLRLSGLGNEYGHREPYAQESAHRIFWHPISQEPLTSPNISSITVQVYEVNGWAETWEDWHEHAETGDSRCELADAANVTGDEYDDPRLARCCGEYRPPMHSPATVTSPDHRYVTIHDYVTAVHTWLPQYRQAGSFRGTKCFQRRAITLGNKT